MRRPNPAAPLFVLLTAAGTPSGLAPLFLAADGKHDGY
jgi:hypothetical protein